MSRGAATRSGAARVRAGLARRRRAERRLRRGAWLAVALALALLATLLATVAARGAGALRQTFIALDVPLEPALLGLPEGGPRASAPCSRPGQPRAAALASRAGTRCGLAAGDWQGAVKAALRARFPEVRGRGERRRLYRLVSTGAGDWVRAQVAAEPALLGTTARIWVPADDDVDMLIKGELPGGLPAGRRRLDDRQLAWIEALRAAGQVRLRFNRALFGAGDSREPELAGIRGALVGSLYMLAVTFALAFPLGLGAAIYLEELAPRNRLTDLVEININNLAAVPSIVFGLLGLALLLGVIGLPRSSPLVGGMVLSLMTLPTVIIAARAALQAVPGSVREAALALGASPVQAVFHQVLPLAMPGVLTGTIIGMAQALGETAPLLLIGMVAFVADVPGGVLDPATALPVQIYLWSGSPERAFAERTAAAILVLLAVLLALNATAIALRRRFERRW